MAINCPKKIQRSWNLDHKCISMCFIKFQKIFEKFQNLADFRAKKRQFFAFFALRFWYRIFYGNCLNFLKKCFKWLDFWYTDSLGFKQQSYVWDFENFNFLLNYYPFFKLRCHFFAKNYQNLLKNAVLAKEMGHNSVKIQNFQNPKHNFVACTLESLYTKNQVIWSIFEEV